MIAIFAGFQKGDPAGIGEPPPSPMTPPSLLTCDGPHRKRLRLLGMIEKILDVLAAIKTDRVLDTVDVQSPAFGLDDEIVSIRREQHLAQARRLDR